MEISFHVGLLPNDNVVEVDHPRMEKSQSQENVGSSIQQNELVTEKSVTSSFEDGAVVQTQAINKVALFVEKCVEFIETNGLDFEGLYRVPGRQAAADRIYQKHKEATKDFNLDEMNVSVNTVATALKIFFQRKMSFFTQEQMSEINDIFLIPDRNKKLLALRDVLTRLTSANYNALMFLIQHLVKVTEKAKVNRMTAKNLAICWCPTILPMNFTDSARYQMVRPQLEGAVEAMIENFAFVFSRENESSPESDGIKRGRKPELKKNLGFFQHVKSTFKNSAQKNLMKNSKTVEAEINSHTTSMVIDKKNYDSFIPTELWGELGKPELQELDEAYFKLRKRTGKYKSLLKQNDIKGYFMGVIKIGENEHLFPILVFDKPEMPNFLGKRVFLVLQLDQKKNADFMQKSKKKEEETKVTEDEIGPDGDQRKDFMLYC
ncbi:rho GTPase-activating protein gacN-like [Daphnia pulicaria]|uniref:rho GTPase-activating protein gacN-like n=1 Tax=Daphnia pulicaria TaxID=35523 RepID=UPI001EECD94A|nr:rho GTPase-activating protein gacN-like [Daphnia pulicaria]